MLIDLQMQDKALKAFNNQEYSQSIEIYSQLIDVAKVNNSF